MKLIHYNSKPFDIQRVNPIKNIHYNKPAGGLWCSPANGTYVWENWCKDAEWEYRLQYRYELELCTERILTIDSREDILNVPVQYLGEDLPYVSPDFERIAMEYDALYLTDNGLGATHRYMDLDFKSVHFRGWDVETVLVLNKDIIKLT